MNRRIVWIVSRESLLDRPVRTFFFLSSSSFYFSFFFSFSFFRFRPETESEFGGNMAKRWDFVDEINLPENGEEGGGRFGGDVNI